MFQSRPITNLDSTFTSYELMHELDSAHTFEREIYTRNHYGELMPGSISYMGVYDQVTEYVFMVNTRNDFKIKI